MSDCSIKQAYELICRDVVFDRALVVRIHKYAVGFVNKNKDHSEFFGGNLTGLHMVRFLEADKNRWWDDVLQAHENDVQELLNKVPEVQKKDGEIFNVAGDAFNQSCVWLCHRFFNEKSLSQQDREAAISNVLLILQFKFLTSRLYRHFRFTTTRALAEATYARLSNKYSIKTKGTWLKVLEGRCEDIMDTSSSHYPCIVKMDSNDGCVRMVNDIQGRIRDMLKNIYNVFRQVIEAGDKISSVSGMLEFDGDTILKDKTKNLGIYTSYLKSIAGDRNSFIKAEILKIVYDMVQHAPPKHVERMLEYISANHLKMGPDSAGTLLEMVMVHSFAYLQNNHNLVKSSVDFVKLLERLRGVYSSSRTSDPDLLALRSSCERMIEKVTMVRTTSVIAAVRTAVLLYLVCRTYSKNHYSGS